MDTTGLEPAYFECKLRTAYHISQRARGSRLGATGLLFAWNRREDKEKEVWNSFIDDSVLNSCFNGAFFGRSPESGG